MKRQQNAVDTYLSKVIQRLADAEFGCDWDVSQGGYVFRCVARRLGPGPKTKFAGTSYLDTFLLIAELPSVNPDSLKAFSKECFRYVKKTKRISIPYALPPDLSYVTPAPVLLVPVAITDGIAPAVSEAVRRKSPANYWTAFQIPVVCDLASNTLYHYERRQRWGSALHDLFRETILPLLAP